MSVRISGTAPIVKPADGPSGPFASSPWRRSYHARERSRFIARAEIYLDHNATTPPSAAVRAAVAEAEETLWQNPSSQHRPGQRVRRQVEVARSRLARLIGASPKTLLLCSGGTEANNLAILGPLASGGVLLTAPTEHAAVREVAESLPGSGTSVEWLAVDGDGRIDPAETAGRAGRLARAGHRVVVSVMHANNETGVFQPVERLAEGIRAERAAVEPPGAILLHTDATQSVGKAPIAVDALGADLLVYAPHKFHGPKGVGVLYARAEGLLLGPRQRGGPQERGLRGGTENAPAIVGAGIAAQEAEAFVRDGDRLTSQRRLRDRLESLLQQRFPDAVVHGAEPRLANTSAIGFPQIDAEPVLLGISERGVAASAGAACSSGSLEPSPVLRAMGVPEPVARGTVRFSLGRETAQAEIDRAAATIGEVVARLRDAE